MQSWLQLLFIGGGGCQLACAHLVCRSLCHHAARMSLFCTGVYGHVYGHMGWVRLAQPGWLQRETGQLTTPSAAGANKQLAAVGPDLSAT